MSLIVTICWLLLALGWAVVEGQFVNDYYQDARLECPANQILSFIGSIYSNDYKDRRWQFQCKAAPGTTEDCYWTHDLNEFARPLLYSCPGNEVLNGMFSYHDNHYQDRQFKVQCCSVSGKSTSRCYKREPANKLEGVMNYRVPDGQAIKGVYSVHDNHYQDRRFVFNVCTLA